MPNKPAVGTVFPGTFSNVKTYDHVGQANVGRRTKCESDRQPPAGSPSRNSREAARRTGRQIRKDKVGAISADCAPIFDRLECNAERWVDFVKNFRKRSRNNAGLTQSLQAFRSTRRESRASA